jgi:hypothetical protein
VGDKLALLNLVGRGSVNFTALRVRRVRFLATLGPSRDTYRKLVYRQRLLQITGHESHDPSSRKYKIDAHHIYDEFPSNLYFLLLN